MAMTWLRRLVEELTAEESEYGIRTRTVNGELVRSKDEAKIADYFAKQGIAYEYEKPAKTNDLIFKETISRPDFYLSDYKIYVEYWGLINARKIRTRNSYRRLMRYKKEEYRKNKHKLIELYPNNLDNLDAVFRARFKVVAGIDLPDPPNKMNKGAAVPIQPVKPSAGGLLFCRRCGASLPLDSDFCNKCGTAVKGAV